MFKKIFTFFQIFSFVLFFSFIFIKNSYSETFSSDKEISSDETSQQKFNAANISLTITNSATLDVNVKPVHVNEKANSTVTIDSGSTVIGNNNAIAGDDTTGLTVNNSGTIQAKNAKAINLLDGTDASITNYSDGIIYSKTNAISASKNGTTPDSITITNSGTIYTTNGSTNTIVFHSSATDSTITNNSGGHIYNTSSKAVVSIGASSTLTNSGKIENKQSPDEESIQVLGSNNTIILKDGGIVIGKIQNSASNTNTLKIQHGVGQSYYYKTSGSGTFNLQDLDGNQIIKGSAGSVGHGGNENLDEQLGYRSLNIRKSLNRYKKSKNFIDKKNSWGEIQASFSKRNEHKKNLALGFKQYSLAANIIYPSENNNFLINFETSKQEFQKNHDIKRFGFISGLHFNDMENTNKFINDSFILAGVNLNDSNRKILTNTTSSGTLDITDNYASYEIHAGKKFNNKKAIPDIGITASYSITPSHSESHYYSWEEKNTANFSIYLSDEYEFKRKENNSKMSIGWMLDYRSLIFDSKQDYSINGAKATYIQDDALTNELSISANMSYKKEIFNLGNLLLNFDGMYTSQDFYSFGTNIIFVIEI